jgi:hypothetical protein
MIAMLRIALFGALIGVRDGLKRRLGVARRRSRPRLSQREIGQDPS